MNCEIVWQKPLPLEECRKGRIYDLDVKKIEEDQGIYIFYRSHGYTSEVLYVGKAVRLRGRVKTQLNNLTLTRAIEESRAGYRYLAFGYLKNKKGATDRLKNIELALIQHYVSRGDGLVNIHGVRIHEDVMHSVERPGLAHLIPKTLPLPVQKKATNGS